MIEWLVWLSRLTISGCGVLFFGSLAIILIIVFVALAAAMFA